MLAELVATPGWKVFEVLLSRMRADFNTSMIGVDMSDPGFDRKTTFWRGCIFGLTDVLRKAKILSQPTQGNEGGKE